MRIRIVREGKPRDPHLRALQADYAARIEHFVKLRIDENAGIATSTKLSSGRSALTPAGRRLLESLEGSYTIVLDPSGYQWNSEEFAKWLEDSALRGRRELAFVVGSDLGIPTAIRERADLALALSQLTLTHDWACTLLLEQIYRGFTILRGYPYAR